MQSTAPNFETHKQNVKKKTSERLTLTVDSFSDALTSPLTVRVAAHPGILNSMGPLFFFAGPALCNRVK
jgi:hypothetical protein